MMLRRPRVTYQGVGVVGLLDLLSIEGAQLQLLLLPLLLLGRSLGVRSKHLTSHMTHDT